MEYRLLYTGSTYIQRTPPLVSGDSHGIPSLVGEPRGGLVGQHKHVLCLSLHADPVGSLSLAQLNGQLQPTIRGFRYFCSQLFTKL